MFEAIIASQMNLIEYGVMLDLNLKGYIFSWYTLYTTKLKFVINYAFIDFIHDSIRQGLRKEVRVERM
jgi:hypothetical protein